MSKISGFGTLVVTVCAGLMMVATTAAASPIVVSGTLYSLPVSLGHPDGQTTVDRWNITVDTAGTVIFDMLAMETDFNSTFDVNGDGEIAYFDPMLSLFSDDGSLDLGNLITQLDDSFGTGTDDGSGYGYDTYLSVNLAVGSYVLLVHACCDYDAADVIDGLQEFQATHTGVDFDPFDHGDYRLTVTGASSVTSPNAPAVPAPGSMALIGLGLLGLGICRRTTSGPSAPQC